MISGFGSAFLAILVGASFITPAAWYDGTREPPPGLPPGCINPDKIVYTRGGRDRTEFTTPDDVGTPTSRDTWRWLPDHPVGMILQEDGYRVWSAHDLKVIATLIELDDIAIHSGAYQESSTAPREVPGPLVEVHGPDDVQALVEGIAQHGAQFELTEKGVRDRVWSSKYGLCVGEI